MPKITEMWVYVAEDKGPDDEGVCARAVVKHTLLAKIIEWEPMVGADEACADSMREAAKKIAKDTKKVIRLLRFSVREEIERFEP